jgi:arylsulfatase A-like enzyme
MSRSFNRRGETAEYVTRAAPGGGMSRAAFVQVLLVAICFGLLCGLAEALVDAILSVVPDGLGWKNDLLPQILWIAPLVNMLLFLTAGCLLAPALLFLGGRGAVLAAWAIFAWLACYAPLVAVGRLGSLACLLLASGIAVQVYRYVGARLVARNLSRRSLIGVALLALLAGLLGSALARQSMAPASSHVAPLADAPNVLLIVLDTLRADHVSAYGYDRPTTPRLDRLAREGTLFERAFATASWTLPSHASLMTGRYPAEHRAGGSPLDTRYQTLAEFLSTHGYATGGFIANTYYCGTRTGLARGFQTYKTYLASVTGMMWRTVYGKMLLRTLPRLGYYDIPARKRAADVNREFLGWLDATRSTPFFAFLNYLDVHDPYIPPAPYGTNYSAQPNTGERVNSELFPRDFTGGRPLSPPELEIEIGGYDGALAYLDANLGALFDELANRRLLDRTLVIVTSDHGESFGNHGLYGHGNSMYRDLIHVPLIMRFPGPVPAGLRLADVVSLQAIPATVAHLAGLASASTFPGTSLVSRWAAPATAAPDFAFSESLPGIVHNPAYPLGRRGAIKSAVTADWHLVLHEEGTVELFHYDDVNEQQSVADVPENRQIVQALGTKMAPLVTPEEWKLFGPLLSVAQ